MKSVLHLCLFAALGVALAPVSAQESRPATPGSDARSASTSTAVDPGLLSTQLADGLYSSKLGAQASPIDRVSNFGSSPGLLNGRHSRKRPSIVQVPATTITPGSTNAPQTQGKGIVPEGSRTPPGRQETPRAPGEKQPLEP